MEELGGACGIARVLLTLIVRQGEKCYWQDQGRAAKTIEKALAAATPEVCGLA